MKDFFKYFYYKKYRSIIYYIWIMSGDLTGLCLYMIVYYSLHPNPNPISSTTKSGKDVLP